MRNVGAAHKNRSAAEYYIYRNQPRLAMLVCSFQRKGQTSTLIPNP